MGLLIWQWHKMLMSWHSMQKSARWAKQVLAEQGIKHMLTSHASALHASRQELHPYKIFRSLRAGGWDCTCGGAGDSN